MATEKGLSNVHKIILLDGTNGSFYSRSYIPKTNVALWIGSPIFQHT